MAKVPAILVTRKGRSGEAEWSLRGLLIMASVVAFLVCQVSGNLTC